MLEVNAFSVVKEQGAFRFALLPQKSEQSRELWGCLDRASFDVRRRECVRSLSLRQERGEADYFKAVGGKRRSLLDKTLE